MKRDPALIPLSQQHHNGLALCVLTDRELDAGADREAIVRLADRIVGVWDVELTNHFEMEEQILFPACPANLSALVQQLLQEHRLVRELVERLRRKPDEKTLRDFTALLRRHIRLEENELFEKAQREISRDILDKIGADIGKKAVRICLKP